MKYIPYRSAINDRIISWFKKFSRPLENPSFDAPVAAVRQHRDSFAAAACEVWPQLGSWADGKGSIVKHWMG